jgi:hypothetical protein
MSQGSAVGIVTGYGLDNQGVGVRVLGGSQIFSSPNRPDRLWGPPNLLFNGYWALKSSRVESYITTDGQLASVSWHKAPIWGSWPDLYYCNTDAGLLMWGSLSNERARLLFAIAAGPRQRSQSWVWVLWDSRPYFTVSDSRLVASYDSQDSSGGMQPRLHMG